MYEDVNLLTPQRINGFVGDGTSTDYYLDAVGIDSVDEIKVNGTVLSSGYTVNTSLGKIVFDSAPSAPSLIGNDNVYIKFTKTVSGYSTRISKCPIAVVFDNRIFFSGNTDFPNAVFHSSLNNPAYCSDLDYYECGNNDNEVKALVVGNNILWVFKRDDQNRDTIFYMTPNLDTSYGRVYPVSQGNVSIGCYSKGINFKDNIVFFSRQGLELMSGNPQYEQNVTHASSMVDSKMINESNYKFLRVCEHKGFMIVAIDNHIYLADSRNVFKGNTNGKEFEWYYWEFPEKVTALRDVLGTLYFGTDNGEVFVMGGTNDDGKTIEAHWCTPRDFFNYVNHYKKTNKRGSIVRTKNIQNGRIKIATKTNRENEWTLVKEASTNGFSFVTVQDGGSFDFDNFSFVSGDFAYIVFRLKKKKFIDLQLKFYLDDETEDLVVGTDVYGFPVYKRIENNTDVYYGYKEVSGTKYLNIVSPVTVTGKTTYRGSTARTVEIDGTTYTVTFNLSLNGYRGMRTGTTKGYYVVLNYNASTDTFTAVGDEVEIGKTQATQAINNRYVGTLDWQTYSTYMTEEELTNMLIRHRNLDKPFGIALVEIENFLGGYAKR